MRRRMIIWRGPSQLDHRTPLVVLATYADGRTMDSANAKTGGMAQFWILRDDLSPHDAYLRGLDGAICGDCKHSSVGNGGLGTCYVKTWQAAQSVWLGYKRDGERRTKKGNPTKVGDSLPFDPQAFAGRLVRLGAYGDPASVPSHIWKSILEFAVDHTAYTHQWTTADSAYAEFCMASADSEAEHFAALAKGYRSFWVRPVGSPKPQGIVQCPAAVEAGKRTTCSHCLQCSGTGNGRTASITIEAHGSTRTRFTGMPAMPPRRSRKCLNKEKVTS